MCCCFANGISKHLRATGTCTVLSFMLCWAETKTQGCSS
jgi:hypothetical protein